MRKSKLKFTFILLLMAIAYSVILGSGVVCAVEQRESTDVSVNPRAENSSASTKLAIAGIGILSLTGLLVSGFLYQQRRTRARRAIEQLDRFREEFLCGPLAEHYQSRYQQNQPTAKSQETLVTPTPPIVNANTEPNPTTDKSIKEPTIFERYQNLIAEIVATALKGQIRSKEYIYRQLVANVSSGTSEIFERSLSDRLNTTQTELDNTTNSPSFFERETPELKKSSFKPHNQSFAKYSNRMGATAKTETQSSCSHRSNRKNSRRLGRFSLFSLTTDHRSQPKRSF